jgi:hypothetical protein
MSVLGLRFEALHFEALSDGAATGLIIALGAGGSFVLVLLVTLVTVRRSERRASRQREMATVGGGKGQDAYPPQPYSPNEPRSHRPYSKPYRIPRQDTGRAATNGSRPAGSTGTGLPMAPWPPKNDEDSAAS